MFKTTIQIVRVADKVSHFVVKRKPSNALGLRSTSKRVTVNISTSACQGFQSFASIPEAFQTNIQAWTARKHKITIVLSLFQWHCDHQPGG